MTAIVDAGPIVAALSRRDRHHAWAVDRLGAYAGPLLTCEAVLTEAAFIVSRGGGRPESVIALVERGVLRVEFVLSAQRSPRVRELMTRYANVPMSLADASLVVLAEKAPTTPVLTLDSDFFVYRLNRSAAVVVDHPDAPPLG